MERLGWVGALGLVLLLGCRGRSAEELSAATATMVPADELPGTDVLPHTAGPIVPGRNYVYCSTFQLAWNELQQSVVRGPLDLEGSPPLAGLLNRGPILAAGDLPSGGYLARAGSARDGIVQQIRREMSAKFPSAEFSLPESADSEAIVAYAYLEKSLPFAEAFDRFEGQLPFHAEGGDVRVAAWGGLRLSHNSDRERALASPSDGAGLRRDRGFRGSAQHPLDRRPPGAGQGRPARDARRHAGLGDRAGQTEGAATRARDISSSARRSWFRSSRSVCRGSIARSPANTCKTPGWRACTSTRPSSGFASAWTKTARVWRRMPIWALSRGCSGSRASSSSTSRSCCTSGERTATGRTWPCGSKTPN